MLASDRRPLLGGRSIYVNRPLVRLWTIHGFLLGPSYTNPKKEREKKTEITNLTNATVTKETNTIMTHVLSIQHHFVNFRLFLFNDTASFLCLLFLFFNPNDTVSIFGFFYYFFTKHCSFLQLLFLFSLFNFKKGARKERESERNGYGTSNDDSSDYWVIKNLGGC